jgi:hypothetical protein
MMAPESRTMKRPRTSRALLLLVLLQLAGGPVILCGVFLLVKLTAMHAPELGVAASFRAACESHEAKALMNDWVAEAAPVPSKTKTPDPTKTKRGVTTLLGLDEMPAFPFVIAVNRIAPPGTGTPEIPQRAHAPPVPPPRVA